MTVTLEEAINIIQQNCVPLFKKEIVGIDDIEGRILCDDLHAAIDQPPFNRSPLDGYALNSKDIVNASKETPVILPVINSIHAGDVSHVSWSQMSAVRIMTGAPIPDGYDCVLRQEDTNYGDDKVAIYKSLRAYDNFCYQGEDTKIGQILLKAHTKLNFIHCGILASQGISEVSVYAKTKVLLITTGNELVDINEPLQEGSIYNTNLYTLKCRLKELGCNVHALIWKDDQKTLSDYLEANQTNFDCIITTGGVSVGAKDIIHDVQKTLGILPIFNKVLMKPGTPAMFWKLGSTPILSLSGNPFAAFATFELMARSMLSHMGSDPSIMPKWVDGIMGSDFDKPSLMRRFIRAHQEHGVVKVDIDNHSSGAFADTAYCNCLIDIPPGNEGLSQGEFVRLVLF